MSLRILSILAVLAATVGVLGPRADAVRYSAPGYAWADFNNDGFGDLALGAPGESIGSVTDAGLVHVFYGTENGFSTSHNQIFDQASQDVEGVPQTGDHFGQSVAVGDFNADGFDDLAIGIPGEKLGNTADTGMVYILNGSAKGLTAQGSRALRQGTLGIGGSSESGDRFGWSLSAGNFDGDAFNGHSVDDLAIGAPGEDFDGKRDAGVVQVLYGSRTGLFGRDQTFSEKTPGLEGDPESGDQFGYALTSGNWNGDGVIDLAIGAPFEGIMDRSEEGVVYSVFGTSSGLDGSNAQFMSQDTIFQNAEGHAREHFGFALAGGDFNRAAPREKKYDDLAIGVPGDLPEDSGAVNVVFGSEHGFVLQGEKLFQGKAITGGALTGSKEAGDEFGATLVAGDFDGNGAADLAIGVPGEAIDSANNVGGVHIISSNGDDFDASVGPNSFLTQDTKTVPGTNESGDTIGAALTATDFNADGSANLVVGCPGEDLGHAIDAGAAIVVGAGQRALLITQDTNGVLGKAESGDRFGGSAG